MRTFALQQHAVDAGASEDAIADALDSDNPKVRKRLFLRHLYIKCIILPRQARDKHRENSKKSGVFLQESLIRLVLPIGGDIITAAAGASDDEGPAADGASAAAIVRGSPPPAPPPPVGDDSDDISDDELD
jgi:hypothetical protein